MSTVVIDSGGANLASLRYALQRLGAEVTVTLDPALIAQADRVLLPGVGAAGAAMQRLRSAGLIPVLRELQKPLLGICLGMQLLFEHSAEDNTDTLGLLTGRVERLPASPELPAPHMGWNTLNALRPDALLEGLRASDRCYFVHGYFAAGHLPDVVATSDYGRPIAAVVRRNHIAGVQFHPERSGAVGAVILRNFLNS
ncbi:MAG: imidazole glycerol phosphate synthase subunit HisH [Pseudomonadota bacterium]|jgi:glutamine amidotransferase